MAHGSSSVANTLVTNGATLEDCHTNVFVLTELTGLKWCRYTAGHTDVKVCTDVCEDPIFRAYSSCLKQDLLCVWRRVPLHSSSSSSSHLGFHPSSSAAAASKIDLRLAAEKELWVFWYGDEQPTALKNICAALTRSEEASWDKGVEYETRLLLFKALHNLIERSLLGREYVRLGKWFVQPLTAEEASHPPKFLLAFNFSFFIHGENNVCVSVNVQRQPPICRFSRAHVAKRETGVAQKVLLAPFCIAATLSRQCHVNFETDSQAPRLWREWLEFYPLPELDNTENMGYVDAVEMERQDQMRAQAPPQMVEVVVGGVRLKYPTAYVLVECACTSGPTGGSSRAAGGGKPEQSNAAKLVHHVTTSVESSPIFSGLLLQRAAEELTVTAAPPDSLSGRRSSQTDRSTPTSEQQQQQQQQQPQQQQQQQQQQDDSAASWGFVDNTQKEPCGCDHSFGMSMAQPKAPSPLMPVLNKAQLKFGCTPSPSSGISSAPTSGPAATSGSSSVHRHQKFLERQNRFGKQGPFHRRHLVSRMGATNMPAASGPGPSPSVPPTPLLDAHGSSESENTPSGRLATTPVTPLAVAALAPTATTAGPCLGVTSVATPSASLDAHAADSGPSQSSSSAVTKMVQPTRTTAACVTTPPSSSFVLVNPPQITTFGYIKGGKRRREFPALRLLRKQWKRPRLTASASGDNNSVVSVGLGLSCPFDEANPVTPSYAEFGKFAQGWCVAKYQKHELSNPKPFSTPDPPAIPACIDYYFPSSVARLSPPPTVSSHQLTPVMETLSSALDIGSAGIIAPAPTSPMTAGTQAAATSTTMNKPGGGVGLPDNIMEESPGDISHEFLSPPPSHGHDDEGGMQHLQNTVSRATTANQNSNNVNSIVSSANVPPTSTTKSRIDYNMIYPTPPSIEAPAVYALGQFSPEAAVVVSLPPVQRPISPVRYSVSSAATCAPFSDYPPTISSSDSFSSSKAINNPNHCCKPAISAAQLVDRLQQLSTVVENERVAQYLLAENYAPRNLSTNRKCLLTSANAATPSSLPVWRRNELQRRPNLSSRFALLPHSTPAGALIRPASPFFPYSSPAQQQPSAPGSPLAALPPPPPYGIPRGWPSPAAVGSPFSVRAGGPRTPGSAGCIYDIQSPVSNASSLCIRNDSSVECGAMVGQTPSSALSTGEGSPTPEGHSLVLSLLLCDTVADLYRDASFDSCPLCVCSMGIMGVDAGVYLIISSAAAAAAAAARQTSTCSLQNSLRCNCGFSAVRYRYLSWRSGLFLEDEYEATGDWRSCSSDSVADIQQQRDSYRYSLEFVTLIRYKAATDTNATTYDRMVTSDLAGFSRSVINEDSVLASSYVRPVIELRDLTEMCNLAIEQACLMMDCTKPSRDDFRPNAGAGVTGGGAVATIGGTSSKYFVADWGYMKATHQATNADACLIMRTLSPVLQESMQKSRGAGSWQTAIEGPLSWRQLHRKCLHRTTNDWSGPEPVPLLLVAVDHEWITASPFALRFWDRLPLEPFGHQKDVVYVAVVPDNPSVLQKARLFFRALSKTYESLRFGRHCPFTRAFKEGIMVMNKKYAKNSNQAPVDPLFDQLVERCPKLGTKLKSYAQICRHYLSPHLRTENVFDKSICRDIGKEGTTAAATGATETSTSMPPPSVIPSRDSQETGSGGGSSSAENDGNSENNEADISPVPHTVVVYIVDAFTFGPSDREDPQLRRMTAEGLYRCYLEVLSDLAESEKARVQMEIIPLETIFETSFVDAMSGCAQADYIRRLAFSVFQQPRCVEFNCLSASVAKPLTGFGTAASRLELIRRKAIQPKNGGGLGSYYQAYCPPVVLAPPFDKATAISNPDTRDDPCRVLFISYCLSENQDWLIASATDHQGCILEDCIIDLRVANRRCVSRRPGPSSLNGSSFDQGPEGSMIWESLRKLWNFITALLATATHPWRLVIGRLGRLGHEELKAWAHFLCRTKLRMTSRLIRERCGMCAALPAFHDAAAILSACLISTEPDPSLRLFPNSFAHDDRFGQGGKHCPLSTPEDVSCTHIMVFPTSAAIHMSQSAIPGGISCGGDDGEDALDVFNDFLVDDFNDMTDILNGEGIMDETGKPFHPQPALSEIGDESIQLQPLALGYLVSTAPSGWLPDWFWTNRPSGPNEIPVHLRSSLHIHTSGVQQSDDQLLQATSTSGAAGGGFGSNGSRNAVYTHPLDSSLTTDVLRYVLETYNGLSWLTFDARKGDRRTCMPVHIEHLCRLYRAMYGFEPASASPPSSFS